MEDADIYIDYQNTGVGLSMRTVKFLESTLIVDSDKDMSGATIFAVKKGAARDGLPVDIAVAWGQNPYVPCAPNILLLVLSMSNLFTVQGGLQVATEHFLGFGYYSTAFLSRQGCQDVQHGHCQRRGFNDLHH
jgi:hypothetical protein